MNPAFLRTQLTYLYTGAIIMLFLGAIGALIILCFTAAIGSYGTTLGYTSRGILLLLATWFLGKAALKP